MASFLSKSPLKPARDRQDILEAEDSANDQSTDPKGPHYKESQE
jgi:hypothetical protein